MGMTLAFVVDFEEVKKFIVSLSLSLRRVFPLSGYVVLLLEDTMGIINRSSFSCCLLLIVGRCLKHHLKKHSDAALGFRGKEHID